MELNLLDILSILNIFASIILIVFLLSVETQRRLSNIFLSLYFFLTIFDSGSQFISYFVYRDHPVIGLLISETVYFIMPLFYLFIKSSVYRDFKLSTRSLLHTLPYLIANIIFIPGYYKPLLTGETTDWVSLIYNTNLAGFIYISIHVQMFTYFFFIYRLLFKYKKLLLENYANNKLDNYKWLMLLTSVFFFSDIFSTVKNVFRFNSGETLYWTSLTIVAVLAVAIVFWLILKALKKPEIFTGVYIDLQLVRNMNLKYDDMTNPNNQGSVDQELIERLTNYMNEKEPFLDPNISLYDLAKQLNVPTRELSILINQSLNKHFFDFINSYRIKKAMDLLRKPTDDKITILEVLYEVGFNSKSSFNTAFKKHTGLTPTEFKKRSSLSVA